MARPRRRRPAHRRRRADQHVRQPAGRSGRRDRTVDLRGAVRSRRRGSGGVRRGRIFRDAARRLVSRRHAAGALAIRRLGVGARSTRAGRRALRTDSSCGPLHGVSPRDAAVVSARRKSGRQDSRGDPRPPVVGLPEMRTLLLAVVAGAALFAQSAASVDDELEKGRQLLQQREYFAALKQYQRANQVAGGKSADAFLGMALAAQAMKTWTNALDFAQSAIDTANGNARLLARAHKLRGQVFAETADPPRAEEAYRAALAADPESNVADLHYGLALALLAQHRDEEAIVELKREIEIRPRGTTAEEAQSLIANPRRGREKYAPDFSFVAADGQTISLDALRGKVVLLDFWASWCAPCVRALPSVKKVQNDHL